GVDKVMIDLNGKLRLHPDFAFRVEHMGAEQAPVLVIDQFLADAQILVDYAAAHARFAPDADGFYPGVRAPAPPIYSFTVRAFLAEIIGAAFGLGASRVVRELSSFSLVTTRPDDLHLLQRLPHFDNTNDRQLALLHYLCPASDGGTSFYRHRKTGFESIRPHRLSDYGRALDSELASLGVPAPRYIVGDTEQFERIGRFEAGFNRMLVYRSITLHSADIAPTFEGRDDPRSGRLTANTFFYYA
ncbi:MAG: DUF6445 family protein, partial [Steroidobacteraceae bacterium]